MGHKLRVSEKIIQECRDTLESKLKRFIRATLIPLKKQQLKIQGLGEGFQWGPKIKFHPNTNIGRYTYIGSGFDSASPLIIGDLVLISTDCKIVGNDHDHSEVGTPTRLKFSYSDKPTIIEADCWIGKRVTIRQGITIGTGSVIGSGSVVVKDVPPYKIYAGIPAKKIKDRFDLSQIKEHELALFEK